MGSIAFETTLIFVLLVLNGIFAMSEAALISSRKARLQQRASQGDQGAKAALELYENPNRFLSTVQIGITLIGIFAGAYGGATLSEELAVVFERFAPIAPYSEAVALALVVAGITFLSLVIGELVPKRLALAHPERIASFVSRPMRLLSIIASPLVQVLSFSTELLLRLLGSRPSQDPPVTQEEVQVMIHQGREAGVFLHEEQQIVERVFRLGDQSIMALMTPRTEMIWLSPQEPPEVTRQKIVQTLWDAYPVCKNALDSVLGVVEAKTLLARVLANEPIDLTHELKKPLLVPESLSALKLLEMMRQSGTSLAMVLDEYSGVKGVVKLDELLEAIVGDLPYNGKEMEAQLVRQQDGSWLLDGMIPISEIEDTFDFQQKMGSSGRYHSLGGFVMTQLKRIPVAGDNFEWNGWRFEVTQMEDNRVAKVLMKPLNRPHP